MDTFGLVLVPLISQQTQIGRENIKFLTNGIEGLVEPGMRVLAWPLSRWARRLEAPVLIESGHVRWMRRWQGWTGESMNQTGLKFCACWREADMRRRARRGR